MFQVDFDPAQLSYRDLVASIWANRRGGRAYGTQYREAVFPGSAAQEDAVRALGLAVPIVPGATFHLAEDYHQKYYLRHDRVLFAELADYTPAQLVESRVAARLNGYVGGRNLIARLRDELPTFGLSAPAAQHLERLVASRS